jgi:hypothetical protein
LLDYNVKMLKEDPIYFHSHAIRRETLSIAMSQFSPAPWWSEGGKLDTEFDSFMHAQGMQIVEISFALFKAEYPEGYRAPHPEGLVSFDIIAYRELDNKIWGAFAKRLSSVDSVLFRQLTHGPTLFHWYISRRLGNLIPLSARDTVEQWKFCALSTKTVLKRYAARARRVDIAMRQFKEPYLGRSLVLESLTNTAEHIVGRSLLREGGQDTVHRPRRFDITDGRVSNICYWRRYL